MAYEIGTAANYKDLLSKLTTFLTTNSSLVAAGQNWQLVGGSLAAGHVVFKAPGLSGTEEIYSGIYTLENVSSDYYNWGVGGAVGYSSTLSYSYHSGWSYLYLWNNSIPYWFVANGQRVIVVAKISTTYQSMYIGKFLPYCLPTQYPYPMFVAGMDYQSDARWSKDNEDIGCFQNPRRGAKLFYVDSTWKVVMNAYDSGDALNWQATGVNVWPTCYPADNQSFNFTSNCLAFPDGGYALVPLIISMDTPAIGVLGELDGVFWVSGHMNSSESIITVGSDNYLVVQDGFRTGKENYYALRLA